MLTVPELKCLIYMVPIVKIFVQGHQKLKLRVANTPTHTSLLIYLFINKTWLRFLLLAGNTHCTQVLHSTRQLTFITPVTENFNVIFNKSYA